MKNKIILIISIVLVSCVFTKQLKAVDFLNKCGETANTNSSSYCVGYLRGIFDEMISNNKIDIGYEIINQQLLIIVENYYAKDKLNQNKSIYEISNNDFQQAFPNKKTIRNKATNNSKGELFTGVFENKCATNPNEWEDF